MKNLVYILALFAFLFVMDSCTKENISPVGGDDPFEYNPDRTMGPEVDRQGGGSINDPDDKDLEGDEDNDTIGDTDEDDEEGEEDNDIVNGNEESDELGE